MEDQNQHHAGRRHAPSSRALAPPSQISSTCLLRMTCEHLLPLEEALLAEGIRETSRGQAWSENCREWVYFDCRLDLPLISASGSTMSAANFAAFSTVGGCFNRSCIAIPRALEGERPS
jgi:hypothetical protein